MQHFNMVRNLALLLSLSGLLALASCGSKGDPNPDSHSINKTTYYAESGEVIINPERGFLHLTSVRSGGNPLSVSYLQSQRTAGISLVWRLYYLEDFKSEPISAQQLALIETDMNNLRTAGLKCVIRFAYTDNSDDGTDAPIDVVEGHLDQLKPLFQAHADVIAFVNAGFAGLWGEWHSSSNDLTSLENQKRIVAKLLEVLPPQIKIQMRTPKQKKDVFGVSTALTDENGYTTSDIARVGHHNDCFMASPDDYGTYQNPTADKNYISQEANYVPTGGETCPPSGITAADCDRARETMAHLKWTYLNLDWYKAILDGWREEGCFEEFEKKMGYRLVLDSVNADTAISKTAEWNLKIYLHNAGWAPVYNSKTAKLILKSDAGQVTGITLDTDIRRAKPGEPFEIDVRIQVSTLEAGTYALYLMFADQFETIADRPEYAIQLANEGVWDNVTGCNDLGRKLRVE